MRYGRMGLAALCAIGIAGSAVMLTPAHAANNAGVIDQTAGSLTLSPEMETALRLLDSDNFAIRQTAAAAIREAMENQLRAMLTTDDPETEARLTELLEFDEGLLRWATHLLKMPKEHRQAILQWGLKPENALMVAKAYSNKSAMRAQACKQLAKEKSEEDGVVMVLTDLLDDDDREVYLAAMEGIWDRPATPAIVDALWARAVDSTLSNSRVQMQGRMRQLKFRGQLLPTTWENSLYGKTNDTTVATDVLINLKTPMVTERLISFFEQGDKTLGPNGRLPYVMYTPAMINMCRMVEAYKPMELVPVLLKSAQQPAGEKTNGNMNNQAYFCSNRTIPLALMIRLTGQNTEDYKVKKLNQGNNQVMWINQGNNMIMVNQGNNMWTFPTEQDEDAAVTKITAWWAKNKDTTPGSSASQPSPK